MKNLFCSTVLLSLFVFSGACGPHPDALPKNNATAAENRLKTAGPEEVPLCPGIHTIRSLSGDPQQGSAECLSGMNPAELLDTYPATLAADGWTLETRMESDGTHHLQFQQNNRYLHLQAQAEGTGSRIRMDWGHRNGTRTVRESVDPTQDESPSDVEGGAPEW